MENNKPIAKEGELAAPPASFVHKIKVLPLWMKLLVLLGVLTLLSLIAATAIFIFIIIAKNDMLRNNNSGVDSKYTAMNAREVLEDVNRDLTIAPATEILEYQRGAKNQPNIAYKLEDDNFSTLPDASYGELFNSDATTSTESVVEAANAYFVDNGWTEKIFPSTAEMEKLQDHHYYVLSNLFVCAYSSPDGTSIALECATLADFESSQNEAKDYYSAYKQFAETYDGAIKENPVVLSVKKGSAALPGYGNKQEGTAVVDGFDYAMLSLSEITAMSDADAVYYYRPVDTDWRAYTIEKLADANQDYPMCSSLNLDSDLTAREAMAKTLCYIGNNSTEVIDWNDYWQNDKCADKVVCYDLGKRRPTELCGSTFYATFDENGEVLTCISVEEVQQAVDEGLYQEVGDAIAMDLMPDAPEESKCPAGYYAIGRMAGDQVSFYACVNRKDNTVYLQGSCPDSHPIEATMPDGSKNCYYEGYSPRPEPPSFLY
ncbi:MAG: hypothetical protein LBQ02_02530 [Candidatus Nomurabacteria bacterium]|jgi:hypothetical protein|nr:hypothetical protein [Candidatus Nomurabacteria bacterium]